MTCAHCGHEFTPEPPPAWLNAYQTGEIGKCPRCNWVTARGRPTPVDRRIPKASAP